MRILVTGGAGFIGSNLVDELIAQGHHVTALDDLSVGKVANIAHHLDNKRFRFVHDSILNPRVLERLARRVDLIYHLAAVVGVKYVLDDPIKAITTNVRGTENVLEAAARHGVRTLVVSSSEVYGKSTAVPLREDGDRLLGPTTVERWCYSDAKAIDEYYALAYAQKGLPASVGRYFNAYGPRLDPLGYGSVIARFMSQAISGGPLTVHDDGQQTRSFTYVADTVRGTILAATVPEAVGVVFNIGSDREVTIDELARLVLKVSGARCDIVHLPATSAYGPDFEDTRRRMPDTTRAREVLGFEASTSLEEGLTKTWLWFQENVNVIDTTERMD